MADRTDSLLDIWTSKDEAKRERAMAARMNMVQLDIAGLKAALKAPKKK
jgi:hypothetical protein